MDIVLLWLLSNEIHRLPWIITPDVGSVQRFRVSYRPRNGTMRIDYLLESVEEL
jgi:hypothetical protein